MVRSDPKWISTTLPSGNSPLVSTKAPLREMFTPFIGTLAVSPSGERQFSDPVSRKGVRSKPRS